MYPNIFYVNVIFAEWGRDMEIDSVFAGLGNNIFLYDTQSIFKYILFLVITDTVSGYCSFKSANSAKLFRLFRYGWKKWYCQIIKRSIGMSVIGISIIYVISYIAVPAKNKWLAFGVFLLHVIFLSSVQATVIIVCNRAIVVYATIILIQLSALFFSQYFAGGWRIILLGNWGCINRSDFILNNGFPLSVVIWIELLSTVFLYLFGWRMVRFFNCSVIHGTVNKN